MFGDSEGVGKCFLICNILSKLMPSMPFRDETVLPQTSRNGFVLCHGGGVTEFDEAF